MTKEEILKMAKQSGFERLGHDDCDYVCYLDEIEAFAKLVAEHEREACAKECWKQMGMIPIQPWTVNPYEECAKAIRARGQS